MSSSVYIYLEICGKKYKSDNTKQNFYKVILNNIGISDEKKEINCIIVDNIEFKFLIRNINKGTRKKSNTIHKKSSKSLTARKKVPKKPFPPSFKQGVFSKQGISPSIRDKIKIFSGETFRKKVFKNKVFPGKIKIPSLFKNSNTIKLNEENEKNNIKENGIKENGIKNNNIKHK